MATEIAKAYVQIVPSAQGITGKLKEAIDPEALTAGESAGDTIGKQIGVFATKAIAALGIGKMISDSITNGMNFESSMAKASTLFSGTDEELQQFQSDLMGISNRTGVAAEQLAEAAYSAESASVPVGNLGGMIEASAQLATAGFTDIDTALSATAKTMNAYGMMTDDAAETQRNMEEVQRILIQTQNKGITTVGELGASLAQVTPTAAAFGVSFDQVGAALAGMTAQGTPTAQATTQLNAMIAELGKEGTTASDNFKHLTEYLQEGGLTFAEAMEQGWDLADVLSIMDEGAYEAGVSMVDMFSSIEAGKAALSISNSDWVGNIEAMGTSADVVTDAYSTMADTGTFKLEQMKTTLTNLGIAAFSQFAEPLSNALTSISTIVAGVAPAFDSLWSALSTLGSSIAEVLTPMLGLNENFSLTEAIISGLTTVIQGVADVIGFLADNMNLIAPIVTALVSGFTAFKVVTGVGGILGALPALSTAFSGLFGILAANPVGLVVTAIAGLAAGITALWNTNEGFRNAVTGIWQSITSVFSTAVSTISSVLNSVKTSTTTTLSNMQTAFETNGGGIKGIVAASWEAIKGYYTTGFNAIDTLTGGKLSSIANQFTTKFSGIKNTIQTKMEEAKSVFSSALSAMQSAVKDKIAAAAQWGADLVSNLKQGMSNGLDAVKTAAGNLAGGVADRLGFSEPEEGPLSNFHTYMPDMIDLLVSGIESGIPRVASAVDSLASNMVPVSSQQNYAGLAAAIGDRPVSVNVSLQGDTGKLFRVVQSQGNSFQKRTGSAVFG